MRPDRATWLRLPASGVRVTVVALALCALWLALATRAPASPIAAGEASSCSIVTGGATCWGSDSFGSRGDGPGAGTPSHDPRPVIGLSVGVADIASTPSGGGSASSSCAVVNASLRCWGKNGSGQLGDGTKVTREVPVQVSGLTSGVTAVDISVGHACAIVNARVRCWGSNYSGRLGDGTNDERLTPVDVGLDAVTSLGVGVRHTCAISRGIVWCWGYNNAGQLGSGPTYTYVPRAVVGLPGAAKQVVAGFDASCALLVSGAVMCWGSNGFGKLGAGSGLAESIAPLQVSGLTSGVTQIAGGWQHFCAIRATRALCWGESTNGRLGDGTDDQRSAPATVPVAVRNLVGITAIATGRNHTCAIAATARWCWGSNSANQLGNEAAGAWTSTPVPVLGSTIPPRIVPTARTQRVGSSRKATVARVECPARVRCTVVAPATVVLRIARVRYTAKVVAPATLAAGRKGIIAVRLSRAAAAALRGRSTTSRVIIAVRGQVTARRTVTTKLTRPA